MESESKGTRSGLPVPDSTASYWHRDPSALLTGHRTTAEVPHAADVVVVGAGITGAFAAWFLMRSDGKGGVVGESSGEGGDAAGGMGENKNKVVVLEAREVCWGATGRNGGHCQPVVFSGTHDTAAFELANYRFLASLVDTHSIPCDWTPVAGGVRAFLTPALFSAAAESAARLKQAHPDVAGDLEIIDSETQKDRLAELRIPGAAGAILQKTAASLWPYKLVAHLLERLLDESGGGGLNLQTNTPVTEIRRSGDGRNWAVVTNSRGTILADKVLVATNAYTSFLLPSFADLIVPVRGQVAALVTPPPPPPVDSGSGSGSGFTGPERLGRSYGFDGEEGPEKPWRSDYLTQRPPPTGEFIFGGGRAMAKGMGVGEWRDDVVEDEVSKYLRANLCPPLHLGDTRQKEMKAVAEWTGIMGYSRDQMPFVGKVPDGIGGGDGLFLCAGFTGHGMPNAVLSAHAVVGMMGGQPEPIDYRLPDEFVLSEERIARARAMVTVHEWEKLGWGVDYPGLLQAP